MKKILHVIAQYPGKTGSGIFLQALVKEGSKKNYKQAVIAATSNKLEDVEFKDSNIKFYPVEFNNEKINFDIVGMSDIMPYNSTKYSDLTDEMFSTWQESFLDVIKKALEEFKPDIIIAQHLFLLTSMINKIKKNSKIIVLSQGTELRQLELVPKYKDIVISGCKEVDVVCALNRYQKEEIAKVYGIDENRIKIMGVGYDSDIFFSHNNAKKHKRIVYAGKISKSKGVKSLISAFKNIRDKEYELVLAGSGSNEEEEIRNFAMDDSRIKFLGCLPQNKLAEIIRESEAFILPSFYEGLPLVIMEALACGTKVIMSDIKGVKEWVGDSINSTGAIIYIDLPRLVDVDIPLEEDVKDYEYRIKEAINTQINSNIDFKSILEEVHKRSWKGYFSNISKYFK